jgi:N-acetylglucosamine-6-phosphate deacetylase
MDSVFRQADAVHDGDRVIPGAGVLIAGGRVAAIGPAPPGTTVHRLGPGWLVPGFVELQVNGGGGAMLGPDPGTLSAILSAHARLGATTLLPTLITDSPERTRAVIAATVAAHHARLPGLAGLHLEGPHLDPRRAGAHDPALIRPMTDADLALYLEAARDLPALMITLAPCAATPDQIAALAAAGVVVSLGHTDATEAEARAAIAAGARAVTHLWNAMSGLSHRAPGRVGATLDGDLSAGLIADGHHIADAALRVTLAARPSGLFLVSDAMAVAGTDLPGFLLGGRAIRRADGRLTLQDGTLAGADLTLPQAVAHLVGLGCDPARTVAMASAVPADLIGCAAGRLRPGGPADLLHLGTDWGLRRVWQGGRALPSPTPERG